MSHHGARVFVDQVLPDPMKIPVLLELSYMPAFASFPYSNQVRYQSLIHSQALPATS